MTNIKTLFAELSIGDRFVCYESVEDSYKQGFGLYLAIKISQKEAICPALKSTVVVNPEDRVIRVS